MAANPPSNSKSGDNRGASDVTPVLSFEEKLQQFWQKNQTIILGLCVLVLLVIIGKGGWEYYQRSQEAEVEQAYANATTPDQLKAFAAAHPGHELAGIAELRIADEAYTAGKSADAQAGYEKALSVLKDGALATRARIGEALAKVQSGKTSEGIEDLKQVANDTKQLKAARAEAAYQLASLAADAGNSADVQKYVDQLNQIDPSSSWARRAMLLRASLPVPAVSAPAAGATDAGASNVQIKLPGK